MEQYLIALCFCLFALFGAYIHYLKDRYFEHKIDVSLLEYCWINKSATFDMLKAVVATAVPLALAHADGWSFTLAEVYGLIGAGYASDSFFNHAYEDKKP